MANTKKTNDKIEKNDNIKKIDNKTKKNIDIKKTTKREKVDIDAVENKIEEEIKKINKKEIKDTKNNTGEEVMIKKTNNQNWFQFIAVCVIVLLLGLLIGYFISDERVSRVKSNITADKNIQNFIEQYNYILENYYGDIDKNELITSAIEGMLSSLDDYSEFISDDSNNFEITLEGSYEGIGIGINNNASGNIVIVEVYSNTPAEKAGILPGDIITKFNGEKLENVSSSELVNMISNSKKMTLTLLRGENTIEVEIEKEKVNLQSVYYEMKENNIGYISVSIFANNTYLQFKDALNALESQGMESLILDLRGNSGGHLSAVENMLYLFMNKTHIIYQTEDKTGTEKVYSKGKTDKEYPIVILQDVLSASASEIMTISLKENLGAYIIGKTSYGKGTVQELKNVSGLGQYKFTTKKWLSPNGNWINDVGIVPDLDVSLTTEYFENPNFDTDTQYQAALNYIKGLE